MTKFTFLKSMLLSVFLLGSVSIFSQTTLKPGDIMIVTVNSDGSDGFDVVPLVDLAAGTVISFTDNAWTGSALKTNEGTVTYTAPAGGITKGTVLSFTGTTAGDWVKSTNYAISASGDNLLVYQGASTSPSFIYGIGWAIASPWITTGTVGTNNSYIPSTLSAGANTIVTLGTVDNYQYKTTSGTTGTASELLALVANPANWSSNDATEYSTLAATFTVNTPTITVTETSVPDMSTSVGDTDTETINVSGANLTADIALAITGANASQFEVSPATLTQTSGAVASTPVTITYRPTSSGAHTATLELTSAGAEKVTLTLNGTAISTAVNNVKITGLTAANGKVKFTASAGEKVQIFNSLGQTIVNQLSVDGLNEILLPNAKGVLVVKVGTKTAKVVL